MDMLIPRPVRNRNLLFLLIFTIAAIFYLYKLDFSDLWSDEIYTKSMLAGSLADFFARFKNDLHPPLYYLGLKLFTAIFGVNAVTLRLFSVMGVLSILLLGYFAGQRIFGRDGALWFCLMLIAVPMLAAYSHQARMYTWASFTVTGVFIWSYLFLKSGTNRDLALLFLFTLLAVYIHYYSMAAAFVANMFVFIYLLLTKNRKWLTHLLSLLLVSILFLPWLFMFFIQIKKVQHAFWAPPVSFEGFLACLTIPFTEQFWTTGYSGFFTVLFYSLIIIAIITSFTRYFAEYRLLLWLSLTIFFGTLVLVTIISLFSQPILSTRYVMSIVTMLAIAPVILFLRIKMVMPKIIFASLMIFLSVKISLSNFSFSYGPYKQTIKYITTTYPEIKKILHISEVTAGPLAEYSRNTGLSHYWLKAEMSNVDAFTEVQQYNEPEEFLKPGEEFCAVRFHNLELNMNNLERVMAESELIKTDTVRDNKFQNGIIMQLYLMKFKGK